MKKLIKKIRNKIKETNRKEVGNYCFDFYGPCIDQKHLNFCTRKEVEKTFMYGLDLTCEQFKEKKKKIKFLKLILKNLENKTHNYK